MMKITKIPYFNRNLTNKNYSTKKHNIFRQVFNVLLRFIIYIVFLNTSTFENNLNNKCLSHYVLVESALFIEVTYTKLDDDDDKAYANTHDI